MGDSYQAIYDAVRSRITGCDIGYVVEQAVSRMDPGIGPLLQQEIYTVSHELQRPSVVYRPRLSLDGNKWVACYGDTIADGCVGIGDSPDLAMCEFDREWVKRVAAVPESGDEH